MELHRTEAGTRLIDDKTIIRELHITEAGNRLISLICTNPICINLQHTIEEIGDKLDQDKGYWPTAPDYFELKIDNVKYILKYYMFSEHITINDINHYGALYIQEVKTELIQMINEIDVTMID